MEGLERCWSTAQEDYREDQDGDFEVLEAGSSDDDDLFANNVDVNELSVGLPALPDSPILATLTSDAADPLEAVVETSIDEDNIARLYGDDSDAESGDDGCELSSRRHGGFATADLQPREWPASGSPAGVDGGERPHEPGEGSDEGLKPEAAPTPAVPPQRGATPPAAANAPICDRTRARWSLTSRSLESCGSLLDALVPSERLPGAFLDDLLPDQDLDAWTSFCARLQEGVELEEEEDEDFEEEVGAAGAAHLLPQLGPAAEPVDAAALAPAPQPEARPYRSSGRGRACRRLHLTSEEYAAEPAAALPCPGRPAAARQRCRGGEVAPASSPLALPEGAIAWQPGQRLPGLARLEAMLTQRHLAHWMWLLRAPSDLAPFVMSAASPPPAQPGAYRWPAHLLRQLCLQVCSHYQLLLQLFATAGGGRDASAGVASRIRKLLDELAAEAALQAEARAQWQAYVAPYDATELGFAPLPCRSSSGAGDAAEVLCGMRHGPHGHWQPWVPPGFHMSCILDVPVARLAPGFLQRIDLLRSCPGDAGRWPAAESVRELPQAVREAAWQSGVVLHWNRALLKDSTMRPACTRYASCFSAHEDVLLAIGIGKFFSNPLAGVNPAPLLQHLLRGLDGIKVVNRVKNLFSSARGAASLTRSVRWHRQRPLCREERAAVEAGMARFRMQSRRKDYKQSIGGLFLPHLSHRMFCHVLALTRTFPGMFRSGLRTEEDVERELRDSEDELVEQADLQHLLPGVPNAFLGVGGGLSVSRSSYLLSNDGRSIWDMLGLQEPQLPGQEILLLPPAASWLKHWPTGPYVDAAAARPLPQLPRRQEPAEPDRAISPPTPPQTSGDPTADAKEPGIELRPPQPSLSPAEIAEAMRPTPKPPQPPPVAAAVLAALASRQPPPPQQQQAATTQLLSALMAAPAPQALPPPPPVAVMRKQMAVLQALLQPGHGTAAPPRCGPPACAPRGPLSALAASLLAQALQAKAARPAARAGEAAPAAEPRSERRCGGNREGARTRSHRRLSVNPPNTSSQPSAGVPQADAPHACATAGAAAARVRPLGTGSFYALQQDGWVEAEAEVIEGDRSCSDADTDDVGGSGGGRGDESPAQQRQPAVPSPAAVVLSGSPPHSRQTCGAAGGPSAQGGKRSSAGGRGRKRRRRQEPSVVQLGCRTTEAGQPFLVEQLDGGCSSSSSSSEDEEGGNKPADTR